MKPNFVVLILCYTGLMLLGAFTPRDAQLAAILLPNLHPHVADLLHAPAYGLFTWLWIVSLRYSGMVKARAIRLAVAMAILCGVFMELAQAFIPGRTPSVEDLFFDAAGIITFTGCYLMVNASRLNHLVTNLLTTRANQSQAG